MEDLCTWMKKYINRHRMIFIENPMTELFIQGFPRLHSHQRNKATCYLRQEGNVFANGYLLDCIMKIDDFPNLFITFCKKNDCNPELARIIEAGIREYNLENHQRHQASQNSVVRPRSEHPQVSFPSNPHATERDQGSTNCEAAGALFLGPLTNDDNVQGATNCVDRTTSDNGKNVVNENMNGTVVAFDSIDQKKGSLTSGRNVEFLLKQLEIPFVCEDEKRERANENSENSNVVVSNDENDRVTKNECIVTDLVSRNVDNEQSLSNAAQQMACPCPHHANMSGEKRNLPSENEIRVSNTLSDTENIQRMKNVLHKQQNERLVTENTFSVCDSNNMDRNDPIKKAYGGTKMTITGETIRADVMNTGNAANDEQKDKDDNNEEEKENVMSLAVKSESLSENTNATPDNKDKPSLQNQKLEENQKHSLASQGDEDSTGSYYLTSSDEEELSPAHNHTFKTNLADNEIENLKLPISRSDCLEQPVQKSDEAKVTPDSLKNTIPKEIERPRPSNASGDNFIMLSTGLSGIQCQDDIEKSKCKGDASTSEKKEHGSSMNQSIESSVSKKLSNDEFLDFEMKNKSIYDHNYKPINVAAVKSVTEDKEFVELCSTPAIVNLNERTELITSEREIKQVEGTIMNKAFKHVTEQQMSSESQCKLDYCHPVVVNLGSSLFEVTTGIDGKLLEVEGCGLLSALNRNSISEHSEGSDGFEVHSNLPASDERNLADHYANNGDESSLCDDLESLSSFRSSESSMDSKHSGLSDKPNVEDNSLVRENNSGAQLQPNIFAHVMSEDSLVLTSYPNRIENNIGLQEISPERAENDSIGVVNNCNSISTNRSISTTRSYIFDYIYTPMRNLIHFPELRGWF